MSIICAILVQNVHNRPNCQRLLYECCLYNHSWNKYVSSNPDCVSLFLCPKNEIKWYGWEAYKWYCTKSDNIADGLTVYYRSCWNYDTYNTQLLKKSFNGGSKPEEVATIKLLEETTSTIKVWMDENRLKMNNAKTEFIFYGSLQQLSKLTMTTIDINGVNIESGKSMRYLGADLDNRLSLKTMINRKCRTMCNLQKIKLIRRSLMLSAATKIALGLVISHLDYANALYAGLPNVDIKKLQRIRDIATKIVTQRGKYDCSTAAWKALHWLPIRQRINFKVCTLVFRSLHGMAPGYLADLLKPDQSRKHGIRSQNTTGVLLVPFTRRKTFADRSFSVFRPKTWNSLPNTLQTNMDYGNFRSGLKAHLFAKAYPE